MKPPLFLAVLLPLTALVSVAGEPDKPFTLYVRVTEKTIDPLLQLSRPGDLFWGRDMKRIPKAHRALTVSSYKHLENRLREWPADSIAAVNLDAEHRDLDAAVSDAKRIREFVDRTNRSGDRREPLRFIAFMHMRIIDAKPEIVSCPDVVMVGKSYWNADNISGGGTQRRRRAAPGYISRIRKKSRTPAILLGDTEKDPHDPATLVETVRKATAPADRGGLNVNHIGFFYPGDKGRNVIAAVERLREGGNPAPDPEGSPAPDCDKNRH